MAIVRGFYKKAGNYSFALENIFKTNVKCLQ